jgi:glycosyl transferase, family 25
MDSVVINLAAHPQRWYETRSRFDAVNLAVERLEATDGRRLGTDRMHAHGATGYDAALNSSVFHKPLRPGEIGCYESHRAAWRRLLALGGRSLAVFEDDIEIDAPLAPLLRAIERLPMPWDMVKLFGREHERIAWQQPLSAPSSVPSSASSRAALVGYSRVPSHSCAYVVSREGARKLLATRARFGRPLDVDLRHWWENGLVVLGVQPYPVRLAPAAGVPTIDDGRRGCSSVPMRLHKVSNQLRYAALNWAHTQARARAADASWSATGRLRLPSHGDLA